MFSTSFSFGKLLMLFVFMCTALYLTLRVMGGKQIARPNQDWIVFACAQPTEGAEIYRMLPDGSQLTQLTRSDENGLYPQWAPKSGWIFFLVSHENSRGSIRRMRFDGTDIEDFWEGSWSDGFDVSPSENLVAFSGVTGRTGEDIYILEIKDDNLVLLPPLTDSISDGGRNWSPAFSPDGEWIAYVSTQDGNNEIYLIKTDGSKKARLTSTNENEYNPAWSPDGKWITFTSGELADTDIFRMSVSTQETQLLVGWRGTQAWASWSPDGEWIIFASSDDLNSELGQIYKMHSDGSDIEQLTSMNCSAGQPQWIAPKT